MAISSDGVATLRAYRETLGARFVFLADRSAALAKRFDSKAPLLPFARRATFVIDREGVIRHMDRGITALDPWPAIDACVSLASGPP